MDKNQIILKIISKYEKQQINKILDFLISEVDADTMQDTIDFVESSETEKISKYRDIIHSGDRYNGTFLEGNQYLISSNQQDVILIDMISEENGVSEKQCRVNIPIKEFIFLVQNKGKTLECINL